tara:strand:+ start:9525 stop:11546 length:2022 start_codon:yes stop_codon:yes gene_type:complete
MSYIITSSTQDRYPKAGFGIEQPYQYTNYLGNAYQVPPNSRVALESIKFVRLPVFLIKEDESNIGYYNFGFEGGGGQPTIDDGTGIPLEFKLDPGRYTVAQLEGALQKALRDSQYHPNDLDAVVDSQYAVNGAFEGFKYTFSQTANSLNTGVPSTMMWATPVSGAQGGPATPQITYTTNGSGVKEITGPQAAGSGYPGTVMFPEYPLSLNGGECVFDISGTGQYQANGVAPLGNKPKGGWIVGLSRPQRVTSTVPTTNGNAAFGVPNNGYPSYFSKGGFGLDVEMAAFYDYSVRIEPVNGGDGALRVAAVETHGGRTDTRTVEIGYWGIANSVFASLGDAYNFTQNSTGGGTTDGAGNAVIKNITEIKFVASGEVMEIFVKGDVYDTATAKYVNKFTFMVDFQNAAASDINLPPIMATKWALFPKVSMFAVNSTLGQTKEVIKFLNYSSVTNNGAAFKYWNSSYWSDYVFGSNAGTNTFYKNIDLRAYNELGTDNLQGVLSDAAGGRIYTDSFVSQFIFSKNDDWLPVFYTKPDPNIAKLMGYGDDAKGYIEPADGTLTDKTKYVYISPNDDANVPTASADSSLFVRIPTLTQTSQNFGKGSMSKIVYHCPQFSNAGAEIGALFFQPAERVYINLNNRETLNLNEITVEVVDKNEELAYELTGNTTVCLHIID